MYFDEACYLQLWYDGYSLECLNVCISGVGCCCVRSWCDLFVCNLLCLVFSSCILTLDLSCRSSLDVGTCLSRMYVVIPSNKVYTLNSFGLLELDLFRVKIFSQWNNKNICTA